MSAAQFLLPLPVREARGRADFVVSESNAAALALIDRPAAWPNGKLALSGAAGTGKTHLVHVWALAQRAEVLAAADLDGQDPAALAEAGAVAVEGLDTIPPAAETVLFHLHNALAARGGLLLVTGRAAPAHWSLTLPDLASRLRAATHVRLGPPDDALVRALLTKLVEERQMVLSPEAFAYLLARIPRDPAAIAALIDTLDTGAVRARRRLTIPFIAGFLPD